MHITSITFKGKTFLNWNLINARNAFLMSWIHQHLHCCNVYVTTPLKMENTWGKEKFCFYRSDIFCWQPTLIEYLINLCSLRSIIGTLIRGGSRGWFVKIVKEDLRWERFALRKSERYPRNNRFQQQIVTDFITIPSRYLQNSKKVILSMRVSKNHTNLFTTNLVR